MKTFIILVMHGAPPRDLPEHELNEFFGLHSRLEHSAGPGREALERRYAELEARLRAWPRTAQNDPFYAGSQALAAQLGQATGCPILVGFNEFCAPSLDEAFDAAVAQGAARIVAVTPMTTRGGEHAEHEIPAAVQRAQERHPNVLIRYAWPFDPAAVAQLLAAQVERFL